MNRFHLARLIAVFAICFAMACPSIVIASDRKTEIQIVTGDNGDTTKRIVDSLQNRFPSSRIYRVEPQASKKKDILYIAIGPSALRKVLTQETAGTIVSLFTSSQTYRNILSTVPTPRKSQVTAIYAEPSPFDQFRLIYAIYKRKITVAVLMNGKNEYLLPILHQAASSHKLTLMVEPISAEENLNRILNRVADAPVLLAIPDNTVYNAENIAAILLTSYRHNQAVMGFSAAFVKAGALASTYSEIDDIVSQLEEMVNEFEMSGRLPESTFPKYFDVIINDNVARSLNLVIDESVKRLSHKPGGKE